MSFSATWSNLAPDDPVGGGQMTVRTPDDVAWLITELGRPGATAAMVYHDDRPMIPDDSFGQLPDHDMTVGVWQNYGYLSYIDDTHDFMVLDGDSRSPYYPAHYIEYDAGTGVTLDLLHAALVQFLETAQRPDNVRWKPEN